MSIIRVDTIESLDSEFQVDVKDLTSPTKYTAPYVGAVERPLNNKIAEVTGSPLDFGAVGDGVADDTDAYTKAEAALDIVSLPNGYIFSVSPSFVFTKPIIGDGSIKINATILKGSDFIYDMYRASVDYFPSSYVDEVGSPTTGDMLSINILPGANHTGRRTRCTLIGTAGPKQVERIDRLESVGNGNFMYTRFAERTTAVGSIVFQWLGSNNPAADNHEWWINARGFVPGQVGWDYQGMETRNPGIGTKIASFNSWATQATDTGRSVGIGRDAFNAAVIANSCVAVGYRAAAGGYSTSNLTAVGVDSFRDGVFQNNSVALGTFAGTSWQEGQRNLVLGYNSGAGAVRGERNTLIGSFAGYNYTDLNKSILIGHGAGNGIGGTSLTNVLAIGNDDVVEPLISGKLDEAKLGLNIKPADIKANLHVRSSSFGVDVDPNTLANEVIVESSTSTGISIRSGSASSGSVLFANPSSQNAGGLIYSNPANTLTLVTNSVSRWIVSDSAFYPVTDGTYSLGLASNKASVVYAATGTINTSDEDYKEQIQSISDEVLDAWALVEYKQYKFKDAVELKGSGARIHFGVVAQQVKQAFESKNIDPFEYGLLCYDEWEATPDVLSDEGEVIREGVEAGSRYGIRYEEVMVLEMALSRRTTSRLEARLAALEGLETN